MPGTITPLPIMLEEEDRKRYEQLQPPKTIVCRYGYPKMIGEFPYNGDAKPGCGSKLVIRSPRGIELGEMLTTTCPNAGCAKSVTRKEMLEYIENSGGKNYPFTEEGRVLRMATVDDLNEQARLDTDKPRMIQFTKKLVREMDLPMRLVEVERLLGGERVIFYYTAEQWVDYRELVRRLGAEFQTRIEMHQVNAREEARLTADYEKCGQYCCCKQFLKVLKPVSMRSAKTQKATLDPTKISGRCGRLMCCLRYEDQTYETLKKRLPHKQTRVMTDDGPGTVIETQILTQLVLVRLDGAEAHQAAYPVENLRVLSKEEDAALRQAATGREAAVKPAPVFQPVREDRREDRGEDRGIRTAEVPAAGEPGIAEGAQASGPEAAAPGEKRRKRRRRRRRPKRPGGGGEAPEAGQPGQGPSESGGA